MKDLAWDATRRNCERLEQKLSIGVGQSAYAYITCDPLNVLEEREVHLGFSKTFYDQKTKFQDTMLHGMDVLVARLPALLPSDIQRVCTSTSSPCAPAHRVLGQGCLQTRTSATQGHCCLSSQRSLTFGRNALRRRLRRRSCVDLLGSLYRQ